MKTKNQNHPKENQTWQARVMALLMASFIMVNGLTGCGTNGTSDAETSTETSSEIDTDTAFPASLAISSPFDTTEDTESSGTSSLSAMSLGGTRFIARYAWATNRIDRILGGASATLCRFDPSLFLATDDDAGCFGPQVAYEAHPNATDASDPAYDGTLPTGDVGIWTETDSSTSHACAAAQLNSRMQGVRDRSVASLMGLASLLCAARLNGISAPSNATQDLTTEISGLGVSNVTFNSASITHDNSSGDEEWSYELDFDYTPGSNTHHIIVDMIHIPSGTALDYRGRLSYRVNNSFTGGNCPSSDVTDNGSLLYDRDSATELDIEVRTGQFCEHDSDGLVNGLVDSSDKYDSSSNPTGWGNNFNIFTANFDPLSMEGDYAYSWQAGPGDGSARIFNVHMTTESSVATGKTFYGYGDDIEDTDGSITGFYCNWAGPSGGDSFQELAQYQAVSFDTSAGVFASDDANLLYAITDSCDYDGSGDFSYDSDIDGVVDTDPATAITNELIELVDSDSDGLFDDISDSGFVPPAAPANI